MRKLVHILILLFMITRGIFAEDIRVEASLDTVKYLIGDWIPVTIKAAHPPEVEVYPPQITDNLGELAVIKWEVLDPEIYKRETLEKWLLTVAAYDTGNFTIPPLEIGYCAPDDSIISLAQTDSLKVYIATSGGDTLSEIHDIKPPVEVAAEFADYLPYIIIAIILIAIAAAGYWMWRKRKAETAQEEGGTPAEIQIEPYQLAMRRMTKLEAKKLWERGFVKEYYSEVTEIVREYLEGEFKIPALEMTTYELFESLISCNLVPTEDAKQLFEPADLVKFAKFTPEADKCKEAINDAYKIIRKARYIKISRQPAVSVEQQTVDGRQLTVDGRQLTVDGRRLTVDGER